MDSVDETRDFARLDRLGAFLPNTSRDLKKLNFSAAGAWADCPLDSADGGRIYTCSHEGNHQGGRKSPPSSASSSSSSSSPRWALQERAIVFWPYWPRRSNLRYTISIGQSLSLSISLSFSLALLRKKYILPRLLPIFFCLLFQKPGQHSSAFHCVYLERYYYIRLNNSMNMMLPPGNSCNHTLDYIINIFGEKCDANEGGEQSRVELWASLWPAGRCQPGF